MQFKKGYVENAHYSILFLVKTWHILALMESAYEEFSEGISDPQIEPQKPSQKLIHTCS